MRHDFDKDYWERHWQEAQSRPSTVRRTSCAPSTPPGRSLSEPTPNPYVARETNDLTPGTALDAGCGEGAEAVWLASTGWQVTAADIAPSALARAAERAAAAGVSERVRLAEADLSVWSPDRQFDLVMTHYAHPQMPQLEFYDRIAEWVAPGGTLLIVGHLHTPGSTGHGHQPPTEASATAATITARLADTKWEVVTAEECRRTVAGQRTLYDVVVRAARRR
ncbi:SAM-dependent methyltransferase [Kribbella sp. NPDC049174]|uniref:SAM-dependent methyltransferase n=1 Tax=Kribbella sp. NPDC049174 TaxID=3364112 RepID=UPI00371F8422